MCLAISRGKEFLDYASNQAGCLYLALEDGIFRLKDRLNKVLDGGKAPSNFYLSIKANGLDGGLIKQLDEEFEEHPDIKSRGDKRDRQIRNSKLRSNARHSQQSRRYPQDRRTPGR